ncbi:MAG: GFA family protein [Rhodospirillales bacterium]
MTDTERTLTGGCLCGAVTYEIDAPFRGVVACHCNQCRKTSGHFVAATAVSRENFRLTMDDGLRWFQSSPQAERGFCCQCGGNLFYRRHDAPTISIMAGTLDQPTGLKLVSQLYPESAGDYYEVDPAVPVVPHESLNTASS